MPTIVNTSRDAIRVSLPGGKVLHLGVGQKGDISERAAESRSVLRQVEEGKVRIEDDEAQSRAANRDGTASHLNTKGAAHTPSVSRSSGDR
jgi:hypothetical protein